ncbi:MAG: TylF/MycF/NovP-related O-methyltransferase [Halioglobus sp.]
MALTQKQRRRRAKRLKRVRTCFDFVTAPMAIVFLTYSHSVQDSYEMTWPKRMALGYRFWRNYSKVTSGTSWRAHLVMAMKLLEISPEVKGDIVECGCWKGGATVNLSLIAAVTGRRLKVYDSFEGLPAPTTGDPIAERSFKNGFIPGVFCGALEEVKGHVRKYGAIDSAEFYKGWFCDTLPHHEGPVVMAFWDVDFYSSLHDCLQNLWPHVVEGGYIFMDEYKELPYCSVFYSEKYWSKYFDCAPPGLVGIGTGVQVGMHFTDPAVGMSSPKIQAANSTAYCVKGTRALWEYYPDEDDTIGKPSAVSEPSA